MNWLIFAILGYFFVALNTLIDKYFLGSQSSLKPAAYAFYVGVSSIFAFVLAPFGFDYPGLSQVIVSFFSGALFILALLTFYTALKKYEVTRTIAVIGVFIPIFTLLLSHQFLGENLANKQIFAFVSLIFGGFFMALEKGSQRYSVHGFWLNALAGFLFAASAVLLKFVFLHQSFVNGLVWSRLGAVIFALIFLLSKNKRQEILHPNVKIEKKNWVWFVLNQGFAALGFILVGYGVSLASVSLINALQSLQNAFLLILVVILSQKFGGQFKEHLKKHALHEKTLAIILIALGLYFLFI